MRSYCRPIDPQTSHLGLIAIDLDGTLLSPQSRVTPRTRAAIGSVVAAGWKICFATGRNWTESQRHIEEAGHQDLAVFVGGAVIVDTRSGSTVHLTRMGSRLASEVCAEIEAAGHAALALQDTTARSVDYWVSDGFAINAETEAWMSVSRARLQRIPRLPSADHQHTLRVGVVATPAEIQRVSAQLHLKFGATLVHHSVIVPGKTVEVLEAFDPSVNKWDGLLRVAKLHGIDPSNVIAIGDDVNDLPMIRSAGLGVAMGNAHPSVKAAAARTIDSNASDGLAKFLEELVTRSPTQVFAAA